MFVIVMFSVVNVYLDHFRPWAKICKSSSRCNIVEATLFLYSG